MIIDSHTHIWALNTEKYPWQPIGGYIPEREASVEMLVSEMDAAGVDGAVLVQPTPHGWDNRYLLDCAMKYPKRFRSVCLVDPFDEYAVEKLQDLVEANHINGIRINWNIHPTEKWRKSESHRLLWKAASDLGLPVCVQMVPDNLPLLREISEAFEARIIIDHLGRPHRDCLLADRDFRLLLELSMYNKIFIKLTGLNYYSSEKAPYENVWPLIKAAFEAYGPQRCMWGSDYPFVTEHWSYGGLLSVIRNQWGVSEQDQHWVLGRTAYYLWWQ